MGRTCFTHYREMRKNAFIFEICDEMRRVNTTIYSKKALLCYMTENEQAKKNKSTKQPLEGKGSTQKKLHMARGAL